jgi:tRNA pseudouridine38/39 synthase
MEGCAAGSKRARAPSPMAAAAHLPASAASPGAVAAPPSARGFAFSRVRFRHVALHVLYCGGAYHGFAAQGGAVATVEAALFAALERACLLESAAAPGGGYSRCGRTDAGVSAAGQVVAARLRSKARLLAAAPAAAAAAAAGAGEWRRHDGLDNDAGEPFPAPADEIDYAAVLNGILPDDVRVAGWADVEPDAPAAAAFSARFSCTRRTYRYFFVDRGYDVAAMRDAAARLCGTHDFRNFAKFDVENQQFFVRRVDAVRVVEVGSAADAAGAWPVPAQAAPAAVPAPAPALAAAPSAPAAAAGAVLFFEVVGQAFLWHQVRCMAAVLFLVGARLETPAVVDFLLDTRGACPSRPQYVLAPEQPLCLHHCAFGEEAGAAGAGAAGAGAAAASDAGGDAGDDDDGDEVAAPAAGRPRARGRPRLYDLMHVSRAGMDAAAAPLRRRHEALLIEAALVGSMLRRLDAMAARGGLAPAAPAPPGADAPRGSKRYVPLAARPREPTLAQKWARLGAAAQRRVAEMHPINTRKMLDEIAGGGGAPAGATS